MTAMPRYRVIYETLRHKIASGVFVRGDLLPSENELSEQYGVTRPTVRKALDMLTNDGFIVRRQGKGSIVKGIPRGIGILSLSSTTSALENMQLRTRIVSGPGLRGWNEAFGFPLFEEERSAGCIYFERLRILDGEPVILDVTMLPDINIPNFSSHNLEDVSLFDTLRMNYGITITGGVQKLYAISADDRTGALLCVSPGHPVLQLNRRIETSRADFHIYSQIFCVTDKYGLSGTF